MWHAETYAPSLQEKHPTLKPNHVIQRLVMHTGPKRLSHHVTLLKVHLKIKRNNNNKKKKQKQQKKK